MSQRKRLVQQILQYRPDDTEKMFQNGLILGGVGFCQKDRGYFPPVRNGFVGSSDMVSAMNSEQQPTE